MSNPESKPLSQDALTQPSVKLDGDALTRLYDTQMHVGKYIYNEHLPQRLGLKSEPEVRIFTGYFVRRLIRQQAYNASVGENTFSWQFMSFGTLFSRRSSRGIPQALAYCEESLKILKETYEETVGEDTFRAIELSVNDLVSFGSQTRGELSQERFEPTKDFVLNWLDRWKPRFRNTSPSSSV